MKYLIPLLILSLVASTNQAEKTPESIIKSYEAKTNEAQAWKADIHYKMKYFSSDEDTLNYYTNCRFIRHEDDTIFGGSLWIKNDSIDRYYDLEHTYLIYHKEKKITRCFPHNGPDCIRGNTISGVLNSYFLKKNRLSKFLEDSTITTTLTDTVIQGQLYSAIQYHFADELPIEQQNKTLYFDENNSLKDITYSVKFQNEWQYNEWHFSNETYDAVTDEMLKAEFDSLAKIYAMEDYKALTPEEMAPLAAGQKAHDFRGEVFPTHDSLSLSDYSGKVVILDFWYKDCFPCIKAIPYLSSVNEKYPDYQLVVLGLNPFDSKEKNRKKLPEFIEINKMSYPTVFVGKEVLKDYNVRGYPAFFVIDKSGEIVFSEMGYSEAHEHQIDSILAEIMK
ncbi:MAG: TlpA disulfide reductase family protein [Bacteroidota bacterium]